MQHKRSRQINQEAQTGLNNPICAGYINMPEFIVNYLGTSTVDCIEDSVHSLFEDLHETRMQEYRVDNAYPDERIPDIVHDLYVKQVPFLYQFDYDEDYTNTVGWIPGINNNELFFISGRDSLLGTGNSKLLETKIDESQLTDHLNKLQARLNLLKDLDKLDYDWNEHDNTN